MLPRPIFTRSTLFQLAAMAAIIVGLLFYNGTKVQAKFDDDSALLVTTRTSFRMCAGVSPALSNATAKIMGRLSSSLQRVRNTNPLWNQNYGANSAVPNLEIVTKTAAPCKIKIPTKPLDEFDANAIGLGHITAPSPFRTVFLVLDEKTANEVLGNRKVSLVPYEMMQISEHESVEVTNALVVRESALEDPSVVQQYMAVAMGLSPVPGFTPPPGEKPSPDKDGGRMSTEQQHR